MKPHSKNILMLGAAAFLVFSAASAAQKPTPSQTSARSGKKAPAASQTQKAAAKPAPLEVPQLKFEKYKLQNGLVVILSEDHRLPMVAVNLWYHVGPANELPGRTGFAHLFEHMMFEGSRHVPGNTHFH